MSTLTREHYFFRALGVSVAARFELGLRDRSSFSSNFLPLVFTAGLPVLVSFSNNGITLERSSGSSLLDLPVIAWQMF
jgi:hypothetical protein